MTLSGPEMPELLRSMWHCGTSCAKVAAGGACYCCETSFDKVAAVEHVELMLLNVQIQYSFLLFEGLLIKKNEFINLFYLLQHILKKKEANIYFAIYLDVFYSYLKNI